MWSTFASSRWNVKGGTHRAGQTHRGWNVEVGNGRFLKTVQVFDQCPERVAVRRDQQSLPAPNLRLTGMGDQGLDQCV